jgi:DNA-directed RNA polymerase specialized sigma24 family protein
VEAVAGASPELSHPELLDRLDLALASLPPAERAAVVAAHGYDEGPVGAAMELDREIGDADALARNGLQLLRAALADVEP